MDEILTTKAGGMLVSKAETPKAFTDTKDIFHDVQQNGEIHIVSCFAKLLYCNPNVLYH